MAFNNPWAAIQGHLAERQQVAENSARLAFSYGFVKTTGMGEHFEEDVVPFGCVFAEEPSVTHGWVVDGDTLLDGSMPRVSAGVYGWQTDQKGHYLGAYVCFAIDVPNVSADPLYEIKHTFAFAGVAIKDLPDYLLDE